MYAMSQISIRMCCTQCHVVHLLYMYINILLNRFDLTDTVVFIDVLVSNI